MAAAGSLILASGGAKADILIGFQAPLTGAQAAAGEQLKRGFDMAVADINAAGGVLGQQLAVAQGDDACDPKQAVAVANKLATKNVVAVVGSYCSGSSIPSSAVYNDANILQIVPSSTSPMVTEGPAKNGWINVFRICGRDDQQAVVAGDYMSKTFAGKPIAIVDDKSTFGKGAADAVRKRLNGDGVKEALDEEITAGDKDFSALITKMKSANIGAIYYGGYVTEAALIVRQAHDQGLNVTLMSGSALPTHDFWQITGPAGAGTVFTFNPDPMKIPDAKDIVAKMSANGFKPEGYTLYTYAAVQVFAQAAKAAGSTKLADLSKAMHSHTFHTVIGDIDFDQKGDPTVSRYVVWQWQDGTFHQM